MATKSQIRHYAKINNVSMGEAKAHFINEAKARQVAPHIAHKKSGAELVGYYWGYKADQGSAGFEFSTQTMRKLGFDNDMTFKLGKLIKDAVDQQLESVMNNNTIEDYGVTREQFVDEEYRRMLGTTQNLNIITSSGAWTITDIVQDLIIWCCAVSTCVAADKIPQDEWNGDKFNYAYTDPSLLFAA